MKLLEFVLGVYALIPVVWVFFLAIMSLQRARDAGKLPKPALFMAYPVLALGYLVDFLGNMTFALVTFAELPREWLVSARLQRYANGPDCWRRRLALWFARNLLDPFDPKGYHIKE